MLSSRCVITRRLAGRHQRPPRPRAPSPHARSQAITPPAAHAAPRWRRRHSSSRAHVRASLNNTPRSTAQRPGTGAGCEPSDARGSSRHEAYSSLSSRAGGGASESEECGEGERATLIRAARERLGPDIEFGWFGWRRSRWRPTASPRVSRSLVESVYDIDWDRRRAMELTALGPEPPRT